MNSGIRFSRRPCQQREYGFILITSMLMLVMLTILGVSMGKSFGLQELIAGNQREKIRAFGAAESTLNYAEWWLNQPNNAGTGTNCTGVTTTPIVCSNALANPTVLDSITHRWLVGVNYTPPDMSISTTGGVGSYYAIPMYYIQYLGSSPSTGNNLYQITSLGYGGDVSSVAVVQSIYEF